MTVDRLIRSIFQDNLKLFQWLQKLFGANNDGRVCGPREARGDTGVGGTESGPSRIRIGSYHKWASRSVHATNPMTRIPKRIPGGVGAGDSHKLEEPTPQMADLKSKTDGMES